MVLSPVRRILPSSGLPLDDGGSVPVNSISSASYRARRSLAAPFVSVGLFPSRRRLSPPPLSD